MAALFTVLLGISFVLLIILIYLNHNVLLENTGIFITLIICMVMMLLVIGVSYFISVYVVSRINHIAGIATNIMDTGDLSKRIDVSTKWDDLSALAFILNDLFAKVDELMIGIRQVSDNIAHDLRTPLTRIRNHLDLLKNNIDDENKESVNFILDEADRLLETFRALLRISNIEKGKNIIEDEEIYVNELIDDVAGLYEPLLEEKEVKLFVNTKKVQYKLDKNLMFQALANMLDNAMKFTPQNGSIHLGLYIEDKDIVIEIADTGKGIPIANKQKVFDRFFREDKSRSLPGNGLGLSLVKAIISLHKGKIELLDNIPCGLKIKITLPRRSL
jgi:two-component system sensor kinase